MPAGLPFPRLVRTSWVPVCLASNPTAVSHATAVRYHAAAGFLTLRGSLPIVGTQRELSSFPTLQPNRRAYPLHSSMSIPSIAVDLTCRHRPSALTMCNPQNLAVGTRSRQRLKPLSACSPVPLPSNNKVLSFGFLTPSFCLPHLHRIRRNRSSPDVDRHKTMPDIFLHKKD